MENGLRKNFTVSAKVTCRFLHRGNLFRKGKTKGLKHVKPFPRLDDFFVKTQANRIFEIISNPKISLAAFFKENISLASGYSESERIEPGLILNGETCFHRRFGKAIRHGLDSQRNPPESFRTMIHGIEASDYREQNLGCAYVGSRFLAANMLLPSLQRKAQSRSTIRITRDSDKSSRKSSFQCMGAG